MRRINWPFAAIVILAVLSVVGRLVLTRYYGVPRFFRHHMADMLFVAFFTATVSSALLLAARYVWAPLARGLNWLTRGSTHLSEGTGGRRLHEVVPILGVMVGWWIELEDYLGLDNDAGGGFDPGRIITDWFGAPGTDTFDVGDLVAILIGGLIVLPLQIRATKRIDWWTSTPLLLRE